MYSIYIYYTKYFPSTQPPAEVVTVTKTVGEYRKLARADHIPGKYNAYQVWPETVISELSRVCYYDRVGLWRRGSEITSSVIVNKLCYLILNTDLESPSFQLDASYAGG